MGWRPTPLLGGAANATPVRISRWARSDRIVAELEAKIQEIERLMTPHAELEPPPKPGPETRNTAKAKPTQAVEQEPAAKGARRKGKR